MPNITFSGLSTGMDTESIIESLVGLERARGNALSRQRSDAQARLTKLSELRGELEGLGRKATDFDTTSEVRALAATSSDDSAVRVTADAAAAAGAYDVRVLRLAQAETSTSQGFDDSVLSASGTLGITVGGDTEVEIAYSSGESLADVAQRINDSDARVSAAAFFDGTKHRLVVTGADTGAVNDVVFDDPAGDFAFTQVVDAQDSTTEINGISVNRASNTLSDVFPGLTMELVRETTDDVRVEVDTDTEASRDAVQGLVDAFNGVADFLNRELSYGGVERGPDSWFGDATLQGLQREMGSLMASTFGADGRTLSEIGVEMGTDGKLTLDAEAFASAVAAEPDLLESLFTAEDGLGARIDALVEKYDDSTDGLLETKKDGLQDRMDGIDRGLEQIDRTAEMMETRLRRQFAALESKVSQLQSQSNYLLSVLLPGTG